MKKTLVLFFSRTHSSARAARDVLAVLKGSGHGADLCAVRSRIWLPYPLWLLLSFIPGLPTPIMPLDEDISAYGGLVLVFPKWTVNCPPVTALIRRLGQGAPRVFIVVVQGGWDGPRYAGGYARAMEKKGIKVAGSLVLKRKNIGRDGEGGALWAINKALAGAEGVFP